VTWLPTNLDAQTERESVLGLHPEAFARHRAFLDAAAEATDPGLLELCKARMAQLLNCREELALHSPDRLAELGSWERSPSFSDAQRAALAFVEQFLLDPSLVGGELVGDLEAELGTSGVINFTAAIAAYEASLRLSTLLDLEPAR
jgi:alkylhydroperoxidase family enzyme